MTDLRSAAREKAQRAVDRNIAARSELAASNAELDEVLTEVRDVEAETVAFIEGYRNPAQPNPAPIAPEVAAPAPNVEPPVFTDVSTPTLEPAETSGGFAETIAPEFQLPPADAAVGEG